MFSPKRLARAGDAACVFKVLCQAPATTSPRIPVRDDPAVRMLGEPDSLDVFDLTIPAGSSKIKRSPEEELKLEWWQTGP